MKLKETSTDTLPKTYVAVVQAEYLNIHLYLLLRSILWTQK